MPKTKEQKKEVIRDLNEKIDKQKSMLFVDYKGLKVKELSKLRKNLKKLGGALVVAKKTLMEVVFKNKKVAVDKEKLEGQPAIIFGFEDEIAPAKATYEFSKKTENLKILGGYLENKFMGAEEMITLAQLPSRKELLAKMVGSISAPMSGFVGVLQGNSRKLVCALSAIAEKKQ